MLYMKKELRSRLDNITNELSLFLEKEFSSQFQRLTNKEDRQLFFLARILTHLKGLSRDLQAEEKIIVFPIPTVTKTFS